jgi:tetratricopeptide (TPR) repeat protein
VLATFVRALGLPDAQVPVDPGELAVSYRSLLAERARAAGAVLVLLDNVSSSAQVGPLLPGATPHRVLVTGRHRLGDLDGIQPVDLDVLEPGESEELLAKALSTANPADGRLGSNPETAREVAAWCGHLPLALNIVTALLRDDLTQPVSELAETLRDKSRRLEELAYGDDLAVRAAFDLSYARLSPDESRLFRLLSLSTGPHISVETAAALAGLADRKARKILRSLCRAHMLQRTNKRGWFRYHDLLRLYAAKQAEVEESQESRDEAIDRMLDCYFLIAASASDKIVPHGSESADDGWEPPRLFAGPRPAMEWLDMERLGLMEAVELAHSTHRYEQARRLAMVLFGYLGIVHRYDDTRHILELALDAARRLGDYEGEAAILGNMAMIFDPSEIQPGENLLPRLYEELVAHRADGNLRREASLLLTIGCVFRKQGNHAGAFRHLHAALKVALDSHDSDSFGDASLWTAITFEDVGELDTALDFYRDALEAHQAAGNRDKVACDEEFLADFYRRHLRQFGEALKHYDEALRIYREAGLLQKECSVLWSMGGVHQHAHDMQRARECWDRALTIAQEIGDNERTHQIQQKLAATERG